MGEYKRGNMEFMDRVERKNIMLRKKGLRGSGAPNDGLILHTLKSLFRPSSRGGSRIFFKEGYTPLLLYFNTNKPHSFLFFCRIPVVLETAGHLRGGVHPLHPPPRSAPVQSTLRSLEMHSKRCYEICIGSVILGQLEPFEITRASVLFSSKF